MGKTYTIRDLANRFAMQPSTLRYYEECGLLPEVARTEAGQRIYDESHVARLEAIQCFKHAGMSIDELKRFFEYESDENAHISQMVELLEARRDAIVEQRRALEEAYLHVLRKLRFYGDIKRSIEDGTPHPDWADYDGKDFSGQDTPDARHA